MGLGTLAAVMAAAVASPSPHVVADGELAQLLQMMALVKLAFVLPMLAITWWRFRAPLPLGLAVAYLATNVATLIGLGFIMRLSQLAVASAAFHVGLLGFFALTTFEVLSARRRERR